MCGGDDYWTDETKLSKTSWLSLSHMMVLLSHIQTLSMINDNGDDDFQYTEVGTVKP